MDTQSLQGNSKNEDKNRYYSSFEEWESKNFPKDSVDLTEAEKRKRFAEQTGQKIIKRYLAELQDQIQKTKKSKKDEID